jgi:hypothetical protein
MITHGRRLRGLLALFAGMTIHCLATSPARAIDFGFGWFGGFNYVPSPGDFLNERANIQALRGMQPRPSHSPYAGNPNAYFNRIRDPGFVPRYDTARRRSPAYQPAPTASPGDVAAAPQPAGVMAIPRPLVPLASFFDASLTLVWPSESPVEGDLKEKRDTSDRSCLVVLNETKQQRIATITSVTMARQHLIDYGQPALQAIRQRSTPRISDAFHLFLLSLYESLAQAAMPPESTAGASP